MGSVLGFLFFRAILRNDREKRFGGSVVVWIALLSLVLLISLIWMRQSMIVANDQMLGSIKAYYAEIGDATRMADEASVLNVRKKVLVVEDEAVNRMMLGNVIEADYDVLYAEDGIEAMHLIEANKGDLALLLLDLQMPRMNGLEVLKAVKADKDLRQLPIIVLTADQDAELECLKIGAVDFIPKPYPAWEIVRARVDRCVELSESREIIKSTERDGLTRLYNIDYFLRYVNLYDQRYPEMAMDAVVVDINQFHMLNERYGKHYADENLRKIGEGIRRAARKMGGVGCRQGADTFLLYCPLHEDYSPLMAQLATDVAVDNSAADRVRLRMGIYPQVDKTLDIERRFDRARMAADSVKGGQSRAIGIYDAKLHEAALFRDRLLEDFHSSVENRRFKVYFQPKFDIRPDKPVLSSAEALLRWDHPELGLISPMVFIPLLEESGMILELDRFVWREAAACIRQWKDKYGFAVPVSVNVSRIDMLNPNLKGIFNEILEAYDLDTEDFMLEITESAYTGESDQVLSTARELRGMGMGFRIEMDDFGTGYSSLGMLTKLPIDALKLDMSFVRSAFGERRDVRMIELIIDTRTDCYLEFYRGSRGVLEIRPGGTDFFRDAPMKLLDGVAEEDAERVRDALQKGRLAPASSGEAETVTTYRCLRRGVLKPCRLVTIPARDGDDHHIVIGVKAE